MANQMVPVSSWALEMQSHFKWGNHFSNCIRGGSWFRVHLFQVGDVWNWGIYRLHHQPTRANAIISSLSIVHLICHSNVNLTFQPFLPIRFWLRNIPQWASHVGLWDVGLYIATQILTPLSNKFHMCIKYKISDQNNCIIPFIKYYRPKLYNIKNDIKWNWKVPLLLHWVV
jgi:hypothetical protein